MGTGVINMVVDNPTGGSNNVFDYNLYYCPNGTPNFGGTTFALWQASGQDTHSKILTDGEFAGLFTDYVNDDFTLPTGSVAIGCGTNVGANFDDGLDITTTWGSSTTIPVIATKQQGASWDVGAYVH